MLLLLFLWGFASALPALGFSHAPPLLPTFVAYNTLPFPRWLSDFTGLHLWPDIDPPYIPLDFITFDESSTLLAQIHLQGNCLDSHNRNSVCSFDCFNCVSSDDVYTCPVLSQTFDDGPSLATPKLVKALRSRSTFFTIGLNVVRYPEIYRATARAGHIMGSHTWLHKFLPLLLNEEVVAQIQWSVWAMHATYGHIPKWFRPPYGGIDNRIRGILRQFGMQAVLWDFDTVDWRLEAGLAPQEAMIYSGVNEFQKLRGNRGLILEHDGTDTTVNVGINLHKQLGPVQLSVPECVGGIDYIKKFIDPSK